MKNSITVTISTDKKLTAEDVAGMIATKNNIHKPRKLPSQGAVGVEVVELAPVFESKKPAKKAATKKAAPKKDEKADDVPETKDENDGTDKEV